MTDPGQFDTVSFAAPVPGRRVFGAVHRSGQAFDVSHLPDGVAWKTLHAPGRHRPFVQAAIPAAKRGKDGTLRTAGTTGFEGVSVVIGPWGQEESEYATVQVSSKALHDGDNVLPMVGQRDLATVLGDIVAPTLHSLGFGGDVRDAVVPRFDAVHDFVDVEAHGRYVAAFADNKSAFRGGRHVMHADETLAQHFAGGMSRLYNKHRESPGNPLAANRSRFEFEMKRQRLVKEMGMRTVADLDVERLSRRARQMFEDSGYDRDVAPVSEWVHRLLTTVPTYPPCESCKIGGQDAYDVVDFDLDFMAEVGSWQHAAAVVHREGCRDPERCMQPMPGFGPAARKGALAHAILQRIGVDTGTHRNTLRTYSKLYELAGVEPATVELFEQGDDSEVVFLDVETHTERRRRKSA